MLHADLSDKLYSTSTQIKNIFQESSDSSNENDKWSYLKDYSSKYLTDNNISLVLLPSYSCVISTLVDSLKPTLFKERWQEDIFDGVFLHGIHHEAFMLLVQKFVESCESYQQQKILRLLQKFLQGKSLQSLFLQQCLCFGRQDPKYIALSKVWDELIMLIVSLPERVANKTKGQVYKIFCVECYVPLLISSIMKALISLCQKVTEGQGGTVEFIGKLIGKLCVLGHGDEIARQLCIEIIRRSEKDFIWRKLSESLITKMPFWSLEPFITHLLLVAPWYGYLDWILGEEGVQNDKLRYIMTEKLLLIRFFKKEIILQNIIGYFASKDSRQSHFWSIFNSLIRSWSDESALKHMSFEQQKYLASALIICSGWFKVVKDVSNGKALLAKVLHGTTIRIGSSKECVRSLAIVVGHLVISSLDPQGPKLDCKEIGGDKLLEDMQSLLIIPSDPGKDSLYTGDVNFFKEVEPKEVENESCLDVKNETESYNKNLEIDSDDDLESYEASKDLSQEQSKRPFYLNDCLQGLIEEETQEWFEQCFKHAENLIESNSDKVHEIAVEMAKVMLHLDDKYSISDFQSIRHRILISLTVHCPVLVADYLTSQFYEDNFNISQRLDILEVLAEASQQLSQPKPVARSHEQQTSCTVKKDDESTEKIWRNIVDQRVAAKTRYITKTKRNALPEMRENRFATSAGYFFFPLMAKYDKTNKMLKLFGEDSYVLGRLVLTLGAVMHAAANIPMCQVMGKALLQFLADVRNHTDVFVREASIFAIAAVFTSVPGYLLFSFDMTPLVFESKEWLQNLIANDPETNCQVKATYALSLILHTITSEMPLACEVLSTQSHA